MVRAHMKQPADEKKETHKKKSPPKKKPTATGVWPCKINGCNKQFAREADLKRHQRTTKTHSIAGFSCPQCDATFTRTDALRRHQKSRHNGVIVEPTNKRKNGKEDEARSFGSGSRSRSATPSRQGSTRTPAAMMISGPSSYYRQHTATNNAGYPPRPPGVMIDTPYVQGVALPTSATRLHQANWPAPPWITDTHTPPISHVHHLAYQHVPGPHPMYYQPSPYYRSNEGMLPSQSQSPHPPQINPDLVAQSQGCQNGIAPKSNTPERENGASRTGTPIHHNGVDPRFRADSRAAVDGALADMSDGGRGDDLFPSAPVIDPSLEATTIGAGQHQERENGVDEEQSEETSSMLRMQAAVEAVLKSVIGGTKFVDHGPQRPEGLNEQNGEHGKCVDLEGFQANGTSVCRRSRSSQGVHDLDGCGDVSMESPDELRIATPDHHYHTPLHFSRPEPMEHILTEDGEPMLNPAELLTQESLASPPPS